MMTQLGSRQVVKTLGFDPSMRRFESFLPSQIDKKIPHFLVRNFFIVKQLQNIKNCVIASRDEITAWQST